MEMAAMPAQAMFTVCVPDGVGPGQQCNALSPDGQQIPFIVPPGVGPGQELQVPYTPMAAAPMPVAFAQPLAPQQQDAMDQQKLAYHNGMRNSLLGQAAVPGGYPQGGFAQAQAAPYPPAQMGMMQGMPMFQGGAAMPMMMPQQQAMGGQFAPAGVHGFDILRGIDKFTIKQQIQVLEVAVGITMPNKYTISHNNVEYFEAQEASDGLMGIAGRQLFEGGDRPFTMDVNIKIGPDVVAPFLRLERPFKCTCMCFQRPEMSITDAVRNVQIGSIVDPFACCKTTFTLHDTSGNQVLDMTTCAYALMCFGCPCGCQEVELPVNDSASGSQVGSINKQFSMGNAAAMVTGLNIDSDQYSVEFGQIEHPEWKAMLIALALFLDFRFFTKGGQEGREGSVAGRIAQNTDLGGPVGRLWGGDG